MRSSADISNADRAGWSASALAGFARVSGQESDLRVDPETILADLLADLMHWGGAKRTAAGRRGRVSFDSALRRARLNYGEERTSKRQR